MAWLFEKIGDVFSRNPTPFVPGSSRFQSLDVVGLIKKLRLDGRAQQRGQQNLPAQGSDSFDEVELEILRHVDEAKNYSYENAQTDLLTYADRIRNLGIVSLLSEVSNKTLSAISDLEASAHAGESQLYRDRQDIPDLRRELDAFRVKHQLTQRKANYPESNLSKWAILVLLFLVEFSLNGVFLAEGSPLGLIGGVAEAAIYASMNVFILARFSSLLIPYIFHISLRLKLLGYLGALVFFVSILLLNATLAHYRIAQEALVTAPHQVAFNAVFGNGFENLFDFQDTKSTMLFVMGMSFALIASYAFMEMDELYPGYGSVSKRYSNALDKYVENKEYHIDKLQSIRDQAIEEISDCEKNVDGRMNARHELFDKRRDLKIQFRKNMEHLEEQGRKLLRHYRSVNSEVRSESGPAHFSQEWVMDKPELPEDEDTLSASSKTLTSQVEENLEDLRLMRTRLHKAFDAGVSALKKVEELTGIAAEEDGLGG